jgi:hypothetical protein
MSSYKKIMNNTTQQENGGVMLLHGGYGQLWRDLKTEVKRTTLKLSPARPEFIAPGTLNAWFQFKGNKLVVCDAENVKCYDLWNFEERNSVSLKFSSKGIPGSGGGNGYDPVGGEWNAPPESFEFVEDVGEMNFSFLILFLFLFSYSFPFSSSSSTSTLPLYSLTFFSAMSKSKVTSSDSGGGSFSEPQSSIVIWHIPTGRRLRTFQSLHSRGGWISDLHMDPYKIVPSPSLFFFPLSLPSSLTFTVVHLLAFLPSFHPSFLSSSLPYSLHTGSWSEPGHTKHRSQSFRSRDRSHY